MNCWRDSLLLRVASFNIDPIIVLDGYLFEAIIKNETTRLIERNHIQIRASYDGDIYIVDVVKKIILKII
jgi:hypothetical protein